jgi:hypothetical protein
VVFSPDGRRLAAGSIGDTIDLWQTADRRPGPVALARTGQLRAGVFSPDGRWLAVGYADGTVVLGRVPPGERAVWFQAVTLPPGDKDEPAVAALAFTPDGRALLVGGPRSLKLWDVSAHSGPPMAGPWRPLFNGRNLDGWKRVSRETAPAETRIVLADGKPALCRAGGKSHIFFAEDFGNCHLRLEFKAPWGNPSVLSGILVHHDLYLSGQKRGISVGIRGGGIPSVDVWPEPSRTGSRGVWKEGRVVSDKVSRNHIDFQGTSLQLGTWNVLEVVFLNGSCLYVLNGKVIGALADLQDHLEEEGRIPVSHGRLGLCFEQDDFFVRRIEVRSIREFPGEFTR